MSYNMDYKSKQEYFLVTFFCSTSDAVTKYSEGGRSPPKQWTEVELGGGRPPVQTSCCIKTSAGATSEALENPLHQEGRDNDK